MDKLVWLDSSLSSVYSQEKIFDILREAHARHQNFLCDEKFDLTVEQSKSRIQVVWSLNKLDNSQIYPVQCIVIKDQLSLKPIEVCGVVLDYIDTYWSEYFEGSRDVYLPIDWSVHESQGVTFYLRGFIRNIELERLADELFAQHGTGGYSIHSISSDF